MTKRHIEKKYIAMLKLTSGTVDKNRVNCYRCINCGHITKTIDEDIGVTPMMFSCELCEDLSSSTFYNDISPLEDPTFRWFRPSLKEVLKRKSEEVWVEHILNGGLSYEKIEI